MLPSSGCARPYFIVTAVVMYPKLTGESILFRVMSASTELDPESAPRRDRSQSARCRWRRMPKRSPSDCAQRWTTSPGSWQQRSRRLLHGAHMVRKQWVTRTKKPQGPVSPDLAALISGIPTGIRTPVSRLRIWRPRPG